MVLVCLSVFLSAAGAWLISKYGHQIGLLDQPNKRSSHHDATPKGGAVGILLSFLCVSYYLAIPPSFWLPAGILAGLSFIGDRFHISPFLRLVFQFTAGLIVLFGYWKAASSPVFNGLLIIPLALFVVATANYYNFMDGINGIAGITGLIGFGLLAVFSHSKGADTDLKLLSICLSFSCLGFLPFNMPQARVFMGDIGSILLGFVFAVLVIQLSRTILDFICLASFLLPFYADEITTELVRLKKGEKLWKPHRVHLYQVMANDCNMPHWQVSIGYGMAQLIVGISILIISTSGLVAVLSAIAFYFTVFSLFASRLRKRLIYNR